MEMQNKEWQMSKAEKKPVVLAIHHPDAFHADFFGPPGRVCKVLAQLRGTAGQCEIGQLQSKAHGRSPQAFGFASSVDARTSKKKIWRLPTVNVCIVHLGLH